MRFQGDVTIDAPRDRSWAFLTDPHQLITCAPGVQSLKIVDENRFIVVVKVGVGPIRGTFNCAVMWLERDAPERARVRAQCKVPGTTVDMLTLMTLAKLDGTRTVLHWEAEATIKGLMAGVAGRFAQGAADTITQRVFACIKSKLEAPTSASAP